MKAFISIYVELDSLDLTPEALTLFNEYLADVKDEVYEELRNQLGVGPANYGRMTKAESGVKEGRKNLELKVATTQNPKVRKGRKIKPAPDNDKIPPGELPDEPPLEAPGT